MPSLIVVGKKEGEHSLGDDVTVIGRDRGVTLELSDFQVSRRHALVIRTDDGCFVKDLGSRNGILVNQSRVPTRRQQKLKNGDVLTLGRTAIVFKDLELGPLPEVAVQLIANPPKVQDAPKPADAKPPEVRAEPPKAEPAKAPGGAAGLEAPRAAPEPAKPAEPAAKAAEPAPAPVAADKKPEPLIPRRARFQELAADDVVGEAASGGGGRDHVALRQLLRRAERERVFYRNLTLVFVAVLMLVFVALLFYLLGRHEAHGDDATAPQKSSKTDKTSDGGPGRDGKLQRVPGPVSVPLGRAGELDARAFNDSVCPLLVRTCATTGCHAGKGAGDLILDSRTDPATLSQNLETVKRFVVPGRPERSPLLTKALRREECGEEHGGGDILSASSPAYQLLRDWIAQAAPRAQDEDKPRPRPAFSGTDGDTNMSGPSKTARKPVARISASAMAVKPGAEVVLDGSSSDAGDGELTFHWTLVDRPDRSRAELAGAISPQAKLVPDVEGSYLIVLTVQNEAGTSEPARVEIECGGSAPAPPPKQEPKAPTQKKSSAGTSMMGGPLKQDPLGRTYVREVMIDLLGRGPRPDETAAALEKTRDDFLASVFGSDEIYEEWYEQELLYFLLIDNFRPEDAPDMSRRVKAKEISPKDAVTATVIGQYFNQRNPGNDTFVTVVLEQLLGLKVQDKANKKLLDAGKKMYDGYSATLFGKTGKNQADVVKIVTGERGFSEHLLRREFKRVTGLDIEKDELEKETDQLEKDPNAFFDIVKGWVVSPRYLERVPLLRPKSERAFIRTLFVDLHQKVPDEEELRQARNALRALADPGPLKAVLAKVLLDSPKARIDKGGDSDTFVKNQFLRLLAREAKPGELSAFTRALDSGTSRDTVVRALVTSAEYEGY
jgi:hypothetical protein